MTYIGDTEKGFYQSGIRMYELLHKNCIGGFCVMDKSMNVLKCDPIC